MSTDDSDDLERVVMLQRLKQDAVDEYVAAHDDVPDSVVDAMNEGGVDEYELYVYEDVAVGIMDVRDLDEFEDVYGDDPDTRPGKSGSENSSGPASTPTRWRCRLWNASGRSATSVSDSRHNDESVLGSRHVFYGP